MLTCLCEMPPLIFHRPSTSVRLCCLWNMPPLHFELSEHTVSLFHLCVPVPGTCGECLVDGHGAVYGLKPLTSKTFLLSKKTTGPHPYSRKILVYLSTYQLEVIVWKRDSVLIPDCSSLARWPWAGHWNNFCRLWLHCFKWRIWQRGSPFAEFCGLEAMWSGWKSSGQWAMLPVCSVPWRFIYVMFKAKQC